jgi:hypothetical protein
MMERRSSSIVFVLHFFLGNLLTRIAKAESPHLEENARMSITGNVLRLKFEQIVLPATISNVGSFPNEKAAHLILVID